MFGWDGAQLIKFIGVLSSVVLMIESAEPRLIQRNHSWNIWGEIHYITNYTTYFITYVWTVKRQACSVFNDVVLRPVTTSHVIQCTMAPSSKFLPLSLYCNPTSNEIIIYNVRVVQWDRSWIVFQEFYTNNKKGEMNKTDWFIWCVGGRFKGGSGE